jgi:hypothetical protein
MATGASPAGHGKLLLRMLVAAILLQDLMWLVVLRTTDTVWPAPVAVIGVGLAFGQVGLAALLVVWGQSALVIRSAVALAACLFGGVLAHRATDGRLPPWLGIMLLDASIVAAPLAVARLWGVFVVRGELTDAATRRSRQFTIWGLLSLTTLAAVFLGIGRLLDFPWEELGAFVVFALGLGAIPWLCGAATLSPLRWRTAVLVTAVVAPPTGWLIAQTGFPPNHPLPLVAMCCVQGLVTLAACAVVRVAGYRLVWPA